MSLQGKIAIVTGSGRGIGAASAIHLARGGAKIVLNYLSKREPAEEVRQSIIAAGGEAIVVQADVTTEEGAGRLARTALDAYGTIDVLVCNAGPLFRGIPLEKMSWEDFSTNVDKDVRAAFFSTRAVLDTMIGKHYGRIIYIGSKSARMPTPGLAHHGASRAAVSAFARSVALEMAPKGITANVVAPGLVETDRTKGAPERIGKMAAMTPLQRIARPDDVARAVVFFASDEEGFYTGVSFPVDGGLAMY